MGNGDRCRAVSFSCVGAHCMRPASRGDRVAVREHGRGQVVGVCNAPLRTARQAVIDNETALRPMGEPAHGPR